MPDIHNVSITSGVQFVYQISPISIGSIINASDIQCLPSSHRIVTVITLGLEANHSACASPFQLATFVGENSIGACTVCD